jgi:methionyl-tRNA synthetase
LREVSFTRDGDYSKEIAYLRLNADLANNIGNLANRTISMTHKYFNGVVPEGELDNDMKDVITQTLSQVGSFMDKYHCNEALQAIVDLSDKLNKYVDSSAPWALAKNNDPQLHNVIYTALEGVRIIGLLLSSFTPGISLKILHQLGYNVDEKMVVGFVDLLAKICPGQKLNQAQPVFVRLGEELADKSSKKKK